MIHREYLIDGMTCGHCVSKAESALRELIGTHEVQVQLDAPQARVTFADETLPLEALQSALSETGFSIRPVNSIADERLGDLPVVWVTGASSGIGRATAIEFAKRGNRVILSSRRLDALHSVIESAPVDLRANMSALVVDLADSSSMKDRVEEAITAFNRIDVVVHCGGISQRSLARDTSLEVDRRVMEIDYFGTIALTKAVLPHFLNQKAGQFVVVTSLMGLFSSPLRSGYCGAKHALHGFFEALRAEVHEDGIGITMVCPGFIHTDISRNAVVGDGSKQGTMDEKTGQGISPEACARQLVRATEKRKAQVLIGRSELLGAYLKRFFPRLLRRIVRRAAVT